MGRQFTSCVMFHKLPRSGSVSLSVNKGGQTGWCLNSPIPIWFSRICFRVELMGTKKGPQEWSPGNVRGALIPGARLPLTSHWGLSVQAGPRRWRPGPPHHCHRSTGGLPLLSSDLEFHRHLLPDPGVIRCHWGWGSRAASSEDVRAAEGHRDPSAHYCLCDVRDEHNLKFRNIKKQKIQVKPSLSNCFPAGL